MKPNFNYLLSLKDTFLNNKFALAIWKPFIIVFAVVVCVVIAWSIYVLILRLRG